MSHRIPLLLAAVLVCGLTFEGSPARAAQPRDKRPVAPAYRTWTDASGTHQIRAAYVDSDEENVQLKKVNGDSISVPLEKLSEADQAWIAKRAAAKPAPAKPAVAEEPAEEPAGEAGADWPGWLGPNRNGKSPDKNLLKQWPSGGPKLLWKADDIGKGFSGVAVAGGTVYITGDTQEGLSLSAYDLAGKRKWRVEHGPAWNGDHPGSRATPAIDGKNLYLLSGTGLLGRFDARTGRRQWVRDAQKDFGGGAGTWGYAESPLVLGNMVIFKPGGKNCIVALNKLSGQPVWSSQGFAAGPEYSSCIALPFRTPLIVTGTREGLVAVNGRTGALVWRNGFAAGNIANCPTPAYSDGHLFWANGYGKGGVCLKVAPNGAATQSWTTQDMACHHGGYILDNGYIYGHNDRDWACLELRTGRVKWSERGVGKGSLCWADGMLYLFSEHGGEAALATCSPDGLEIKGRMKVAGGGPSWAHPVVIGGRLYLRYDNNLYCFDVRAK